MRRRRTRIKIRTYTHIRYITIRRTRAYIRRVRIYIRRTRIEIRRARI